MRTISHHIREAWLWRPSANRYFFCDDPACTVAYFGDDGSIIAKSQLRSRSAAKGEGESNDDLLCYCFGVSKADFIRDPSVRNHVIAWTKAGLCSCETSNPSGRCCLKDFPQPES